MPRVRLGVVLLIPPPAAQEIVGIQRALGSPLRVPPHVTLVPPVNVAVERLDAAIEIVRRAAAGCPALRLALGPVLTFWPDTPVVYLAVGGDVDAVGRLRGALSRGPFDRPQPWPFVPHVTLAEDVQPDLILPVSRGLGGFHADVGVEVVHVLREGDDRVWSPIADARLGGGRIVGRGGIEVEITAGDVLAPDAEAFFARSWAGYVEATYGPVAAGRPFAVTARTGGEVAGVALGTCDDELWVDRLVVDPAVRGGGVGTQLLTEAELAGAAAGCRRGYLLCRAGSPSEAWYLARGWRQDLSLTAWRHGRDFVRLSRDLPL